MSVWKVVVTDHEFADFKPEKEIFSSFGEVELCVYQTRSDDEETLMEITRDANIVIAAYAHITEKVINNFEKCKAIIRYGIGTDNFDVEAATRRGVYVCNIPDYGIDEVAAHAVALLLTQIRKIPMHNKTMKEGGWSYTPACPTYRIADSTLGLIGFGRMPRRVAEMMRGFNINILAYDPYVNKQAALDAGVRLVELDELCKESDYISIHCPLSDSTHHLIGKHEFSLMKKRMVLVNTSRGPVVDEASLIKALATGQIASAGLDVFEKEPLAADSPLRNMENVVCTPHAAWYSEESILLMKTKAAQEAVNILAGNPPFHPINHLMLSELEI